MRVTIRDGNNPWWEQFIRGKIREGNNLWGEQFMKGAVRERNNSWGEHFVMGAIREGNNSGQEPFLRGTIRATPLWDRLPWSTVCRYVHDAPKRTYNSSQSSTKNYGIRWDEKGNHARDGIHSGNVPFRSPMKVTVNTNFKKSDLLRMTGLGQILAHLHIDKWHIIKVNNLPEQILKIQCQEILYL